MSPYPPARTSPPAADTNAHGAAGRARSTGAEEQLPTHQYCIPGPHPRALFAIGGAKVVQQLLDIVTDPAASLGYRDRAAQGCLFALRNTHEERPCGQVVDVAVQELRSALRASPTRTRAPRHVTSLVRALEDALGHVASWSFPDRQPVPPPTAGTPVSSSPPTA